MKIVLIRHGRPDFDARRSAGAHEIGVLLQQYREARVTEGPNDGLERIRAKPPVWLMTSALVRAQDSARLVARREPEISELLNEAELPYPDRLFVPMPWSLIPGVFRIAWLFGYRSNAPGLSHDLRQARLAAKLLVDRATEHACVVVFGHGIMNRLIARELARQGWDIQSKSGRGYWSSITLGCGTR